MVNRARELLKKSGIDFTYLKYGSDTSQWRIRLALKMWTDWPAFPMVFVDQMLVGGSENLQDFLNEGVGLSLLKT